MTYTPFTWHDGQAGGTLITAAQLNHMEQGIQAASAPALRVLAGPGIDPTGATVSTTAVQAILTTSPDGTVVVIPDGAIINLDAGLTIDHRIRLTGAGELRWTAGIASTPMINVTADGCHFDGVHLTNPNHLAAKTGNRTYGIHFRANSGRVTGCRIVGQQQAICVEASGEWHDFTIIGNLILDVPGSGDGPTNTTSAAGEDRGDGIICWGAGVTITGNRVTALAGTDARVGIHVEALGGSDAIPYVHADSMAVISSNVVTGQFRRSITNEGLSHVAITGNAVADATWYAINIVNAAHYTTVTGNTVKWTRTPADNQGQAWSPVRAGIWVYDNPIGVIIANNTIVAAPGSAAPAGIGAQVGNGGNSVDLTIQNNTILGGASLFQNGVAFTNGATRPRILGNRISGFSGSGVTAASCADIEVSGNKITGGNIGIGTTGTSTSARVDGNTITSSVSAIQAEFRTGWTTVSNNVIDTATTGINLLSTTGVAQVSNNLFIATTTKTTNLPTGTTSVGNN